MGDADTPASGVGPGQAAVGSEESESTARPTAQPTDAPTVPAVDESTASAAVAAETGAEQVAEEQAAVAEQQPAGETAAPEAAALAAERLADLQRLQAEYVNYKRRVDRDRAVVQERAVHSVLEALLPVLDDIHAAREHGDLTEGPFAAIADKLESTLGKFGLERFGEGGEPFDPMRHEALMHTQWPEDGSLPAEADTTTVVQVLQPGYRAGEQVIRAARVAVADPQ